MQALSRNSWIVAAVVLIIGFLFLHADLVDYGASFFIAFPLMVGFSIGTHDRPTRRALMLTLTLILFFGFLLTVGLEGLICVLMALPIFATSILLGYAARRHYYPPGPPNRSTRDHLLFSALPLLVVVFADKIEATLVAPPDLVEITTTVELPYAADRVFDEVKAMDKLDAPKPWGIWLGLPAPYRCVLPADTVGARRVCLFRKGQIVAEITKFERGEVLEMDVVEYTLTGREWFRFNDATYKMHKSESGGTTLTRTSSYRSVLRPRWYWEPLEKWGIAQEHDFVLASLRKNLDETQ